MAYKVERKRGQSVVFLINGQRIEVKIGRIRCGRVNLAVDADKQLVKIIRNEQLPAAETVAEGIPLPTAPEVA